MNMIEKMSRAFDPGAENWQCREPAMRRVLEAMLDPSPDVAHQMTHAFAMCPLNTPEEIRSASRVMWNIAIAHYLKGGK